jgi:hypothetical protein
MAPNRVNIDMGNYINILGIRRNNINLDIPTASSLIQHRISVRNINIGEYLLTNSQGNFIYTVHQLHILFPGTELYNTVHMQSSEISLFNHFIR